MNEEIDFELVREQYIDALKKNVCKVVFIKKDKSKRTLNCTLNPSKLAVVGAFSGKTHRQHIQNDDVISVWDLDNDGWRSFTIENVISFEVLS